MKTKDGFVAEHQEVPRSWPDLGRTPAPSSWCALCRGGHRLPSYLWRICEKGDAQLYLCLHCYFRPFRARSG